MDIKAELIKIGIILLPIISMLIPKVLGDARARNLLRNIEVGADLKTSSYKMIIKEVEELKELTTTMINSKDVFEGIKNTFEEMTDDFKLVDKIKEEIEIVRSEISNTMESIQSLMLAVHDTVNVKTVIEEQNEMIEELRNEIKKLNNRFGGK